MAVDLWGASPLRAIARRNRGVSMSRRYQELRWYFQGWVGYFGLVPIKSCFSELDKWVRRRIRCCYWKHWRCPRTRIAWLCLTQQEDVLPEPEVDEDFRQRPAYQEGRYR